jgi:hypothetical protein
LGCRKLTLAEEETVTVKKWYKLNEAVQAGRWEAERVGEHSVYVTLEGDTAAGVLPVWMSTEQFAAWFQESEMDVEMSVEELAGEREGMRDGQ